MEEEIRGHWNAAATYADGTEIDKDFPYCERGNYKAECDKQYALEWWLMEQIEKYGDIEWHSVTFLGD